VKWARASKAYEPERMHRRAEEAMVELEKARTPKEQIEELAFRALRIDCLTGLIR
jgi:hypothetical protein